MSQLAILKQRARATGSTPALGRADVAVLAFCALGVGNLWARRGAGNVVVPADVTQFVIGLGLVVLAAGLCLLAWRLEATPPSPVICAVALVAQTIVSPVFLLPVWALYLTGATLALVPLLRRPTMAWCLAGGAAGITALLVGAHWWDWSATHIDVFTEVQNSTSALLHGQNPYHAVYAVFLDSPFQHPRTGSGSFDYGPAVLLLSIPGRLLGDVRYTVLALNLSILAAALLWVRRSQALARVGPTVGALWIASPFVPLMVLMEWTDTFCMAGAAWWLVLRDRHRNWAILCLTLALASKPSMLPLLLPLLLWTSAWRELLWAAVGTVAIACPFALWTGIPQFVYDTVGIYGDLPNRRDSVSLDGISWALGHGYLPAGLLLLGTLVAMAAFSIRRVRDYGDMLMLGAGLMIVVCLLAKQAFLNYYYDAAIALLFVVGTTTDQPRDIRLTGVVSRLRGLRVPLAGQGSRHPSRQAFAGAPRDQTTSPGPMSQP